MAKALRLMKIKELLTERGAIDTQTLCALTGVSKVTIRSDLIHLEEEGFLHRTYGGAVLRKDGNASDSAAAVPADSSEKMRRLAELGGVVQRHVASASWVMLGYGVTCREIARSLLNQNIRVVTGNIDAAVILSESSTVEIFIPGGYLRRHYNYLMLNGEWYQKALVGLTVDQAYIGVAGIDPSGFTVGDVLECQTLELIRKIAREVIVVIDSGKFDRTAFFRLGDLEYADTIITNDDIPDSYRELFREKNIRFLTPSSL
ncbi:DeoR/GlpR family DNA-binding transcription regulator [Feifania hominis]|uniref:DeoR/GlpR transcriptional regulator n=1 Tax=Feifania hominis TaxID=2763660 RepID=A0A926HQJ4_9FIRM|nr:DeoR/GlpR family DNA-binding transcription regulator [Feifania hominis]MBC8536402.1 DeoR/GlpR transcriptional regulator [Feifania hominis]